MFKSKAKYTNPVVKFNSSNQEFEISIDLNSDELLKIQKEQDIKISGYKLQTLLGELMYQRKMQTKFRYNSRKDKLVIIGKKCNKTKKELKEICTYINWILYDKEIQAPLLKGDVRYLTENEEYLFDKYLEAGILLDKKVSDLTDFLEVEEGLDVDNNSLYCICRHAYKNFRTNYKVNTTMLYRKSVNIPGDYIDIFINLEHITNGDVSIKVLSENWYYTKNNLKEKITDYNNLIYSNKPIIFLTVLINNKKYDLEFSLSADHFNNVEDTLIIKLNKILKEEGIASRFAFQKVDDYYPIVFINQVNIDKLNNSLSNTLQTGNLY